MVFQNPDNQLIASVVEEDVAFGPENLGLDPDVTRQRVDDALKAVDMYEHRTSAPHHLSGGQKQRIAIAGIIAMEPECIVLDEPTAMLDPVGRKEVMNTIEMLNREKNMTVIHITHYMEEAVRAERVIVINDGKIALEGTPHQVFKNVDKLRAMGLETPQGNELILELKNAGLKISGESLTESECIETLYKFLS